MYFSIAMPGNEPLCRAQLNCRSKITDSPMNQFCWRKLNNMKKKLVSNVTAAVMQERIDSNQTATTSSIGSNLVEAARNCLTDQASTFDGIQRLEILAARRVSSSFIVQIVGHEGEAWEVWEFEVFGHTR